MKLSDHWQIVTEANVGAIRKDTRMANSVGDTQAFPCGGSPRDSGMTYRQWLVGMAMQGIRSNTFTIQAMASQGVKDISAHIAAYAVEQADAVIAELEKS